MIGYHVVMPEQAEKLLALGVPSDVASMAWCEENGERVVVEIPRGMTYDHFKKSLVNGVVGENRIIRVLFPCWLSTELLDAIPELYCDMLSDEVAEEMDEEENREWSDVSVSLSRENGEWTSICYCVDGLGSTIATGSDVSPIEAIIQMLMELSTKISLSIMRSY